MAKGYNNEPTVIVIRERPRGMWVFGSAAMGALLAVTIMHLIGAPPRVNPPPTVVTVAPPPVTTDPIVVPGPPSATASTHASPVVHFSDDQGVAIAKPKPKPAAPKSSGPAPMVPDGVTAKVEAPPPPAAAKPTKKPLTPDQELSEAQLKASLMK